MNKTIWAIGAAMALAGFGAGLAVAQGAAPTTMRTPQFANGEVKVWKSLIMPGNPLPLHRHDHPRVIIALKGGTMHILEETGPAADKSDIAVWEAGKAYWLPANPKTQHQDINIGKEPIEVMVVELQKAW
jgi:quercetin dioxygenase-like cupin family protein